MLPYTHVSTILADVVGPKCAARVSALTSRKRLTLAPVRLGWGPEGFAEKYTMPFSPPRLTNANSNPRAPPLRSCRSLFLPVSLVPFLAPLRAHQLCVHPHRVEAEVGIKCCHRGGLASREPEGVGAPTKTIWSKRWTARERRVNVNRENLADRMSNLFYIYVHPWHAVFFGYF